MERFITLGWEFTNKNIGVGCKIFRRTSVSHAFLFTGFSFFGESKNLHLLKRSPEFSLSFTINALCSLAVLSAISLNLTRSAVAFSNLSRFLLQFKHIVEEVPSFYTEVWRMHNNLSASLSRTDLAPSKMFSFPLPEIGILIPQIRTGVVYVIILLINNFFTGVFSIDIFNIVYTLDRFSDTHHRGAIMSTLTVSTLEIRKPFFL